MKVVLCVLNRRSAKTMMDLEKKAYQTPDLTLVRFSATDVVSASEIPPVGEGETPIVIF